MSDPDRLIDGTGLEARLLAAAIEEPPPRALLARTLTAVGAAAVTPGAPASQAGGTAAHAAATQAAGGGIAGAIGIGVLAGVLTVGAVNGAAFLRDRPVGERSHATEPRSVVPAIPPDVTTVPAPPLPATAEAPARTRAEPEGAPKPESSPSSSAKGPRVTLATEIALLDEARSALAAGDPARARALMDRYAREVPHGQMAREAALLRAQAVREAGATNP